jgi:hypothetical protein
MNTWTHIPWSIELMKSPATIVFSAVYNLSGICGALGLLDQRSDMTQMYKWRKELRREEECRNVRETTWGRWVRFLVGIKYCHSIKGYHECGTMIFRGVSTLQGTTGTFCPMAMHENKRH